MRWIVIMRAGLLSISMTAIACYRAGTPATPAPPDQPPSALVQAPMPPPSPPSPTSGYLVAGCNTACTDCALHGGTYVIGTLDRTGEHLFPNPNPPGPPGNAYSCSASVAIGERVTLVAHTTEAVQLGQWRAFFASDYCPCAGTNATACRVVVTPEIAAGYSRVYCGADWVARPTVQIGH